MQTVKLTYFKASGKYYSDGEMIVDDSMPIYEIFSTVRGMADLGVLPGLVEGVTDLSALVRAPGHIHDYPQLIHPK